jgi:hypothetical protein
VSDRGGPPRPPIPPPRDPDALQLDWLEFRDRRAGMIHAMSGGLWLLDWGRRVGMPEERLQYHPLKDPRDGIRRDAWHWDLGGPYLPLPR